MSINQSFALNPSKMKKFGSLFGTIDFEPMTGISRAVLQNLRGDTVVGTFSIGDTNHNVTIAELDRIIETATSAKEGFQRRYILGI